MGTRTFLCASLGAFVVSCSSDAEQAGPNCAALSEAIAAETSADEACTTTVRLSYHGGEVRGFQIACGPEEFPDEATARATAQAEIGFGAAGELLSGPAPADEWVFFEGHSDWRDIAFVSARTGLAVFGGTTTYYGGVPDTFPSAWRSAVDIGPGCIPTLDTSPPEARGFKSRLGEPLPDEEVALALDLVWHTALPDGLAAGGNVLPSMVLFHLPVAYPVPDDASPTEWVVLINSRRLE